MFHPRNFQVLGLLILQNVELIVCSILTRVLGATRFAVAVARDLTLAGLAPILQSIEAYLISSGPHPVSGPLVRPDYGHLAALTLIHRPIGFRCSIQ